MRMSTKKEKQPKTSTVLLFSIIVFILGLYLISYNYLVSKKEKIYSKMNLLLYDDEIPERIDDNKQVTEPEVVKEEKEVKEQKKLSYNYIGKIQIDKINLNRGFLDINSPYNNVSRNVTVIEKSSYPDVENGNLILAAHSGNCAICYFDKLYKLALNDKAIVDYNNYKYTYILKDIYNVPKTGEVEIRRNIDQTVLTLITCTHGSDTEQSVYIFELSKKEKK